MHRLRSFFLNLILFRLIIGAPHANLHNTHGINENHANLSHDCLRITAYPDKVKNIYEVISYCLSEIPVKSEMTNRISFADLWKRNISSEDLYVWSAPIDVIEDYQFYLNEQKSNNFSYAKMKFSNCTLPRFGPQCQYEFVFSDENSSSLKEMIQNYYKTFDYNFITNFSCYAHLECSLGGSRACLHWMQICDGKIDCLNDGLDEADCWQLEINECQDNGYRCGNGQCIPGSFYQEYSPITDCLDTTDEQSKANQLLLFCENMGGPTNAELSFECDDVVSRNSNYMGFTIDKHLKLILKEIYSTEDSILSQECSSALKHFLNFKIVKDESYEYNQCLEIIQNKCPSMFYFPPVPILYANIYFAYRKTDFQNGTIFARIPFYICANPSRYDTFLSQVPTIDFNDTKCFSSELIDQFIFPPSALEIFHDGMIKQLQTYLRQYHLIFNYTSFLCNRSNMYQCRNSSKCISIYRLKDSINDCPLEDDENFNYINTTDILKQLDKTHYKCPISGKYIHPFLVRDGICHCSDIYPPCEDEYPDIVYLNENIVFQHICDGFVDIASNFSIDRNQTDETDCEQWKCNNTYTRCNQVWNCPNGADEAGCRSHPTLNCSWNEHLCVSPQTYQFICLSVDKVHDGKVACLGGTDETQLCGRGYQKQVPNMDYENDFYCKSDSGDLCLSSYSLCNNYSSCIQGDDERFCTNRTINRRCSSDSFIPFSFSLNVDHGCSSIYFDPTFVPTDIEMFLFEYKVPIRRWGIIHFKLDEPVESNVNQEKTIEQTILPSSSEILNSVESPSHCHRGLPLRIWLRNSSKLSCLCPPSYYGSQCQYQNERVSLTMQFRALASSWQTLFAIVVQLIDDSDQRMIHSYEQLTFLSLRDCQTKFNVYLLYSTRPKNPHRNYSIHIDIYEKNSLEYRGSLIYPVLFRFLPVYRLSVSIDIPKTFNETRLCSTNRCVHGQCIKYSNNSQNMEFCKCDERWSGEYCHIQHDCHCSVGSICIGISSTNRSICLCPLNRYGPRCLLVNRICEMNNTSQCENGGECVANNDYIQSNRKFTCICRQGFRGDRCQVIDNKLTLSFNKDINPSESLSIHFIEVGEENKELFTSTTFKTIPVKQDSVIIDWPRPFHLVFIEFFRKTYYLAVIQKIYNESMSVNASIKSSDRCPHVNEVLNETIAQWDLLRRIKYYHLPCEQFSHDLKCFYDEKHLCICYDYDNTRLANCFAFEHEKSFDCWGQSECEYEGKCFQDRKNCPQRSICVCPSCYYGTRCQFHTNGFGLSLDAILRYYIYPYLSFSDQPVLTHVSLVLTIIFIVIGLVNGIFSLMTFKNKAVREVGCGLYLLSSSIATLLITTIFGLKYLLFILIQMTIISNRSFLSFQCYTFDFLLQVCLSMDQWLNACVAVERTISVVKKTSFNKKKSKQAAKYLISIVLMMMIGTCIHDPIHRHIIDEEINDNIFNNQKRSWCIVRYSSALEIYNYIIHIIHFVCPFLMNILSAGILIVKQAHQKSHIHTDRQYREHLREQYQEHRHLLISPIILVVLALPRLIFVFVSRCMQSANDAWLFLIGYFIAFIPPMLTFLVFISPSKFYKEQFDKSVQQFRRMIQQRFSSN